MTARRGSLHRSPFDLPQDERTSSPPGPRQRAVLGTGLRRYDVKRGRFDERRGWYDDVGPVRLCGGRHGERRGRYGDVEAGTTKSVGGATLRGAGMAMWGWYDDGVCAWSGGWVVLPGEGLVAQQIQVLVPGAGVQQDDLLVGVEEAVFQQTLQCYQGGGSLGAYEQPLC